MKVLITTDLFTTDTNGVVTSVRNLRAALEAAGHEVRILTFSENRKSHAEGGVYYIKSMSLEWVYPNVRMPLKYRHPYVRELIEWCPDVIHTQCEVFSYQYALKISKKTGAPIVHTYHTMYEDYVGYVIPFKRLGRWLVRKLVRYRLKKAKSIIVPTAKVEASLRSYGMSQPMLIIPSGIDLSQHRERITAAEREDRRKKLGIPEDAHVIINLGRLGTEKNVDELIEYYKKLSMTYPELHFLIVGDGPAKEKLETLAKEYTEQGKIIFTGMVNPKEVHLYYQLGDIFVSASTSETQGLTYVEAMANGLPLLCRRDDCLDGVLIDGANGFSYENAEEFYAHLEHLLKDRELTRNASVRSRELAERFDRSHFGRSVIELYCQAINEKEKIKHV